MTLPIKGHRSEFNDAGGKPAQQLMRWPIMAEKQT